MATVPSNQCNKHGGNRCWSSAARDHDTLYSIAEPAPKFQCHVATSRDFGHGLAQSYMGSVHVLKSGSNLSSISRHQQPVGPFRSPDRSGGGPVTICPGPVQGGNANYQMEIAVTPVYTATASPWTRWLLGQKPPNAWQHWKVGHHAFESSIYTRPPLLPWHISRHRIHQRSPGSCSSSAYSITNAEHK